MKKTLLVLAVTLGLLLGAGAAPAAAQHQKYYGDSSRAVAEHIGCTRFFHPAGSGRGELNKDSGVCWLRGKRVNVITFRGSAQQREWNSAAKLWLPSRTWWANGKGALVVAKNGNRPAAKAGVRALPGRLVKAY